MKRVLLRVTDKINNIPAALFSCLPDSRENSPLFKSAKPSRTSSCQTVRGFIFMSLDADLWRIPGERMKMDSPHTVPLSRQAVAVLERAGRLYGKEGLIFPGRDGVKPLSEHHAFIPCTG